MQALPVSMYVRRRAGNVTSAAADWGRQPPVNLPKRGRSAAQNAGLRYEAKALEHCYSEVQHFIDHLSFRFVADFVSELCIPDGIALAQRGKTLTVIEVKHRHTADAWFQLHQLYLPVVSRAFPSYRIQLLEICKSYDPAVKLPCKVEFVDQLESFVSGNAKAIFGIYIWRGR